MKILLIAFIALLLPTFSQAAHYSCQVKHSDISGIKAGGKVGLEVERTSNLLQPFKIFISSEDLRLNRVELAGFMSQEMPEKQILVMKNERITGLFFPKSKGNFILDFSMGIFKQVLADCR